jgi:hypothetical protein
MTTGNCPSCGKPLNTGAVLCVECGFDVRTGRTLTTQVAAEPPGQAFASPPEEIGRWSGPWTRGLLFVAVVLLGGFLGRVAGIACDPAASAAWIGLAAGVAVGMFLGDRLASGFCARAPGDEVRQRLACGKFRLALTKGFVAKEVLVCDNSEDLLACIRAPGHLLWTCATFLLAASLVLVVPFGTGWLLNVLWERAGKPDLPDHGQGLGAVLGFLLIALFVVVTLGAGILAARAAFNLMAPRRRLRIWEDDSRRRLMLRVVETWKFGTGRVSVKFADGQLAGRILHERRRRRYVLLDDCDEPLAALAAGKVQYTTEWDVPDSEEFLQGCLLGLLFGLLGLLAGRLFGVVPRARRERSYSEWFLYRASSLTDDPTEKIGRVTFNPARNFPYHVELSGDPQRTVDRALVVALAGLLDW